MRVRIEFDLDSGIFRATVPWKVLFFEFFCLPFTKERPVEDTWGVDVHRKRTDESVPVLVDFLIVAVGVGDSVAI